MISAAMGAAVLGFGIFLAFADPDADDDFAMPRATLAPVAEGSPTGKGVRGQVVRYQNHPLEGLEVTLTPLFDEEGVEKLRDETDARGRFAFEDVRIDPGSPWVAEVEFDGARFASPVLRAPRTKNPVKLVVANTTTRDDELSVTWESVAVIGDKQGAQAVHAFELMNEGKRAYTGPMHLPLLEGATAVQEGGGLDRRYLSLEKGELVSRAPVLPGRHSLTYTYVVQMSGNAIQVEHTPDLPTSRFELLVGGELTVESKDAEGTVKIGPPGDERTYDRFVVRGVKRGDSYEAVLVVKKPSNALRKAGLGVAAILALGILLIPLFRRRRTPTPPEPVPETSTFVA